MLKTNFEEFETKKMFISDSKQNIPKKLSLKLIHLEIAYSQIFAQEKDSNIESSKSSPELRGKGGKWVL